MLNLQIPEHAYMYGFFQADGHLSEGSRNRGKFRLELSSKDGEVLHKFKELLSCNSSISERVRSTNFADDYHASCLTVCTWEFRKDLKDLGYIVGNKGGMSCAPVVAYSPRDYYRGLFDANGSVGLTAGGFPFASVVTNSDYIAASYKEYASALTLRFNGASRNTRDNVYNIAHFKEEAQSILQDMYYPECLCLGRKRVLADNALSWVRPIEMRRVTGKKSWVEWEDEYVQTHSVPDAMLALGRTAKSIQIRQWRLRNAQQDESLYRGGPGSHGDIVPGGALRVQEYGQADRGVLPGLGVQRAD